MTTKGLLEVASIKLPYFDGAVFSTGGELGVLGMKSECSYVFLMSAHLLFRRSLRNVQIFINGVRCAWFIRPILQFLLKVLDLFFKVSDLFLQKKDGLPLKFKFIALLVDICQRPSALLSHHFSCSCVVILYKVL